MNDRFYIELFRDNSIENLIKEKNILLKLSKELDIPLVCSNDIFFLNDDIYEAHDCLNCISQNTTIENPK